LNVRLSLLLFLQFAIPGSLVPLFTLWLQELDFTPLEMGWTSATSALASLVAPVAAGQVADRWYPAERCLGACCLVAGALLWVLAGLTSPLAVFVGSLAFWLVMTPVLSLGTTIAFTHLKLPDGHFGRVRLWGTVGWMVPGWVLGYWFSNPPWLREVVSWVRPLGPASELADMFRLAALLAVVLGAYAWTLPHTPPRRGPSPLAMLSAVKLLRRRPFLVYAVCLLGVCVTIPFSTQGTPLLLKQLGIPRPWISPTLTIAQYTEIVCLALLPVFFRRLGVRGTMLAGITAWGTALAILSVGRPTWLVVGSLGLNGLCICCFLVAGQVFVNRHAPRDVRASAQGLLSFVGGLGLLSGNLLVGWVRQHTDGDFHSTFSVAAAIATLLALVFFVAFSDVRALPVPAKEPATL
jgi:MFS family permease